MLKGDCNKCLHGDLPEDCETCVRCGIARKNYAPINADEYISREAAYNAIVNNYTVDDQLQDLCSIPAADVAEVVRCKDCDFNYGTQKAPLCKLTKYRLTPNSYCSCGFRKIDESENEK